MDTATYRLQCALRHPDLQRDMLSIHQKYPPLFYLRNPEKGHPPLAWLPQEVQPLVVKKDAEHLALVPKTFWDIPLIYDAYALKKEGYQFLIDVDPAYDRVLQVSWWQRKAAFDALLNEWPALPKEVLLWGWFQKYTPPDLLYLSNDPEIRRRVLERLMNDTSVQLLWLIRDYSTLKHIHEQWPRTQTANKDIYGQRRMRPDTYEKRLKVWDAYQESSNFVTVAKDLIII